MIEFKSTQVHMATGEKTETSYSVEGDLNIEEAVEAFQYFLLSVGYHPKTVERIVVEYD